MTGQEEASHAEGAAQVPDPLKVRAFAVLDVWVRDADGEGMGEPGPPAVGAIPGTHDAVFGAEICNKSRETETFGR